MILMIHYFIVHVPGGCCFFGWLAGKMFVSKGGGSSRCLCQRVVVPVQRSIDGSAHILVDFDDPRSRYLATGVQSPCSQET